MDRYVRVVTWTAPGNTEQREQQAEITDLFKHLNAQEQQVIQTRYQLGQATTYGMEDIPLPYAEVSRQLGMTTGLVKATEIRALLKISF